MLRNYLLVTFRNLYRNRVFALINILGLGVALAICIVAYFNHMFGHNFDRQNEHFEQIYRVTSYRQMQDRNQEFGIVPAPLGMAVREDIPGISNSARLMRSYSPVKVGIENFNRRISYVDPEFLDIFTFHMVAGEKQALDNPNLVLVSEEMADVLYGDEGAMGKPVSIFNDDNKEYTYTIGGVFRDLPQNSSFRIDILTNIENFFTMWNMDDTRWEHFARVLFIQVPDPSGIKAIAEELEQYIPVQNEANESFTVTGFNIIPLEEVKNSSREIWSNSLFPGLHPAAVVAPLVMALVILLIACFNFANTAIATSGKRLLEIGMRKVMGGNRRQLMIQFLIENYIICFLALLVGIAGAYFLVPAYGAMWEYMDLSLSFSEHKGLLIFLVLLLLFAGFLAGAYPAFFISSFRPLSILQSRTRLGSGGPLAKILLGFQFTVSVLSIVSGIIFSMNAVYQDTLDLGYARKELLAVPLRAQEYRAYADEVVTDPRVRDLAGARNHPGFGWYRMSIEDEQTEMEVNVMDVGPNYMQTMGFTLNQGRFFSKEREDADRGISIVVNQMMVDAFGWDQVVDRQILMSDTIPFRIVGVVKDFYINGMWSKIEPTMLKLAPKDSYYGLSVRADADDLPGLLETLREKWKKLYPNYPFAGMYQEDTLEEEKSINRSIKQLYIFLAIVATLLSMTGLYTLVSLSILNRTKEIGIRKVMGAPIARIIVVLSRSFMINLAISSVLGCVGGYYLSRILMDSIWENFLPFRAGIFIWSALIILIITTFTIAGRIYRAANMNPTDCIRYE